MRDDKETKKKYSKMAESYDKSRFSSFGGKLLDKKQKNVLLKFLKDIPINAKILEIGCGSGRFLEFLESKGYKNIYGMDSSKEMLDVARKKTKAKLEIGDVYRMPYKSKSMDVVFSVHVLMHVKNPKKMISEMLRVSKNTIIVDITNKNSFSFIISKIIRGYKPKFFSLKEIKKLIPKEYNIKIKPTYMFPIRGKLNVIYYAFSIFFEKLAFLLSLGRFASQLFLKVTKE